MKTLRIAMRGLGLLLAVTAATLPSQADAIAIAPLQPGQYQAGSGVDAQFLKVYDDWRRSSVLYDADTDQLGAGVPIGSFLGGSGLWGWSIGAPHITVPRRA